MCVKCINFCDVRFKFNVNLFFKCFIFIFLVVEILIMKNNVMYVSGL